MKISAALGSVFVLLYFEELQISAALQQNEKKLTPPRLFLQFKCPVLDHIAFGAGELLPLHRNVLIIDPKHGQSPSTAQQSYQICSEFFAYYFHRTPMKNTIA